jgi:hypothetical protein
MKNIDVNIYLTQFKTFFKQNPQDLINLIGDISPDNFYSEVKKQILENNENGDFIELTQKQLIDVIVRLNKQKIKKDVSLFFETKFGNFSLN